MRVPNHIRQKLSRIAALSAAEQALMRQVENWLEKNGFDPEDLRSGDGCSLEEFEYGNDITDLFCAKLEAMGNPSDI